VDPIDLDWTITRIWPGDPTANGYVPPVGEHVFCHRSADGKTHCGTVDDNRSGLFLTTCHNGRVVLTAANWTVRPTTRCRPTPAARPDPGSST
jgi:hypothetical protein